VLKASLFLVGRLTNYFALSSGLLRRTKATEAADLELPPRIVTLRPIQLHPIEQDFYNALYMQTKASFNDYVEAGTLLNNYAHIFVSLTIGFVLSVSMHWWLTTCWLLCIHSGLADEDAAGCEPPILDCILENVCREEWWTKQGISCQRQC
jgi:SNF2 family DNA or RNA helicase